MGLEKYEELRYCRVRKGTKKPFEKEWQKKLYTLQQIQKFIEKGENYGVLCGHGNLAVIDSDTKSLQTMVEHELPITLRVKTGSGGTHNYFFISDLKNKIILTTKNADGQKHYGEVQSYGAQVVGPNSIHPNGNRYEVLVDKEIATISYELLIKAIKPFMQEVIESIKHKEYEQKSYGVEIDDLSVADIWGTGGLKSQGNEYYGEHPIHGSSGGMNFWINPLKNTWHCFRCNSGGGVLSAIAVKEGIIDCSEARQGYLRGAKAKEAIEIGKDHYGLLDKELPKDIYLNKGIQSIKDKNKLVLWSYQNFKELKKDTNFLIQDVIYPKTVTMMYSPPGQFKSILALQLAMAVAQGKEWMKFSTRKHNVLYCDKENNDQIIKDRLMMLFEGMNYEEEDFPLYILRRQGDLKNEEFVKLLSKEIQEKEIKLIIFDTLHRFADYDENRADDINWLYTKVFQPLIEDHGISIIFLHHTSKSGGYRGSGDFLGMVDTAYSIVREGKTNKFRIINEKCRAGEIENIIGEIDFGEDFIKIIRLNEEIQNENKLSKLKELTQKIQSCFKEGQKLRKKEIEDQFEMEDYEYSVSTLKRSLKWLVDNQYLDKDDKNLYSRILR